MMSPFTRGNESNRTQEHPGRDTITLHHEHATRMDITTLYKCLWLRSLVFNGEQQCTEPDLDGRELEPNTVLVWASVDGHPVGTLRILDDGDRIVIGRVVVDADHRGLHIAQRMMTLALELARADGREITLHAQSYLENWYGAFGFVVTGPHFTEAGIDHVPMTLTR